MSIDEAKEEFDFFNEGDYITREMVIAKDIVLKKLHETESDLYEANNRINDLLDLVKQKDELIDLMAQELIDQQVRAFKDNFDPFKYINKEQVKKYFEERCKNAKN